MNIVLISFETCIGQNALFLLHCKSQLLPVESIAVQESLWITFENVGQRERKGVLLITGVVKGSYSNNICNLCRRIPIY